MAKRFGRLEHSPGSSLVNPISWIPFWKLVGLGVSVGENPLHMGRVPRRKFFQEFLMVKHVSRISVEHPISRQNFHLPKPLNSFTLQGMMSGASATDAVWDQVTCRQYCQVNVLPMLISFAGLSWKAKIPFRHLLVWHYHPRIYRSLDSLRRSQHSEWSFSATVIPYMPPFKWS